MIYRNARMDEIRQTVDNHHGAKAVMRWVVPVGEEAYVFSPLSLCCTDKYCTERRAESRDQAIADAVKRHGMRRIK